MYNYDIMIRRLPLLVAITLIFGFVHLAVQQVLRQSANDPQVQIAEDAVEALNAGQSVAVYNGIGKLNIEKTKAPYIVVYNDDNRPVAGNGLLGDELAAPPADVLEYAKEHEENRLTWEPKDGARHAIIVLSYNNGTLMAGRSLGETEKREKALVMMTIIGWIVTMAGALVADYFVKRRRG